MLITNKIMVICQPRTASSTACSYFTDILQAKFVNDNVEGLSHVDMTGPVVVKLEDAAIVGIEKRCPEFFEYGPWTAIILKRRNLLDQILSVCQRIHTFTETKAGYIVSRTDFFFAAYLILKGVETMQIFEEVEKSKFKYAYEIYFEDLQEHGWGPVIEKLGTPDRDYLITRNESRDKWGPIINKEEVSSWIEELRKHYNV